MDIGTEDRSSDVEVPKPGKDEVLVDVHAAGLNFFEWVAGLLDTHADTSILQAQGKYQSRSPCRGTGRKADRQRNHRCPSSLEPSFPAQSPRPLLYQRDAHTAPVVRSGPCICHASGAWMSLTLRSDIRVCSGGVRRAAGRQPGVSDPIT